MKDEDYQRLMLFISAAVTLAAVLHIYFTGGC